MSELLEPEYAEPFKTWSATRSPQDADRLLASITPVIDTAITSYGRGNKSPLLRSRARRIALDSLGRYRPQESKLKTYLLTQLKGLQRESTSLGNIIHVPEAVLLERQHVFDAQRQLEDELGREPSDMELADRTSIPMKRLAYIRGVAAPVAESAARIGTGANAEDPAVIDQSRAAEQAWAEMVYHDLGPIDQAVMEMTLGLRGRRPISTTEIAKRLGLSPGAISQRAKRIQGLLDQRTELQAF